MPDKSFSFTALLKELKYWSRAFSISLRISVLSIITLVIIALLIWMDQGSTLIVDLIDHRPVNLALFWILSWAIREIASHYPTYFDKWRIHRNEVLHGNLYHWQIDYSGFPSSLRKLLEWWKGKGIGFVTYSLNTMSKEDQNKWNEYHQTIHQKVDVLRRLLGLIFIFLVIYAISRCWVRQLYSDPEETLNWIWWILLLGMFAIFWSTHYLAKAAKKNVKVKDIGKQIALSIFYCGILLQAFSVLASYIWGWHPITISVVVVALVLELFSFCFFKNFRGFFQTDNKRGHRLRMEPRYLSNYTRYLGLIGLIGMLSVFIVVCSHFCLFWYTPIVIIFAYILMVYGLIVIPAKHYFYYMSAGADRYSIPKFIIPSLPILLLALSLWAAGRGNDLHLLPLQKQEAAKTITLDSFVCQMHQSFDSTDTVFFIASYGGGLKANVWNMLVLNELSHRYQKNIVEHTIAMSGVSGGALGIAFFSALYQRFPGKDEKSYKKRMEIIRKMGSTNMLSMDVTYALGGDFLREFWPRRGSLMPDRAKIAMREYGKILQENPNETTLDKITFQNYWYELFSQQTERGAFYPMLLINSAATHIQRGISCTVDMGDQFDDVFHDAIDLTHFNGGNDQSLSYLHATSTANRFPVASPAAKIDGKGHFLDGGYFENSGMLTLWDFYCYLKNTSFKNCSDPFFKDKKVQFIQINNDKYNVIHDLFGRRLNDKVTIREEAEWSAVVGTITSISMLPKYLQRFMENQQDVSYANIHLPYILTESDVMDFRKSSEVSVSADAAFEAYNKRLEAVLQTDNNYDRIAPPLARLLGPQAVRYMELVIEDGNVFEELEGQLGDKSIH